MPDQLRGRDNACLKSNCDVENAILHTRKRLRHGKISPRCGGHVCEWGRNVVPVNLLEGQKGRLITPSILRRRYGIAMPNRATDIPSRGVRPWGRTV